MTAHSNMEAEQAVLGAILWDNSVLERIANLEPSHFAYRAHQLLFEAAKDFIHRGKLADGITLREHFIQIGELESIGGAAYLLTLMERAGARLSSQQRDYANILVDLGAKRELERIIAEASASMASSGEPAADVVSWVESELRKIDLGGGFGATLQEAAVRLIKRMDDPNAAGMPTGFEALDKRLGGLFGSELILVAGRPSMGKTALATNVARNLAGMGRRGHFASYEMSDEAIAGRSLSAAAFAGEGERFAYAELRRGANNVDRKRLNSLAANLPATLIIDDTGAQTLGQLDASLRQTRRRLGGLDFCVVDYLQLMRSTLRGTRNDQITEISQGLKALAKRYKIPIIALSQLSRANEQRDDKRPQLSDLRDSGSLEQDADVVLGVYREHYYLSRAEPKLEHFKKDSERSQEENFNLAYWEWEAKMRRAERSLEVSTLKQRAGPVGTDELDFWDKYDVATDVRGAA